MSEESLNAQGQGMVLQPEVLPPSNRPSDRIKLIHSHISRFMADKDWQEISRQKLMPGCPEELLRLTPEMVIQQRGNDPHTLLAAVIRYLDEEAYKELSNRRVTGQSD